MNKTIEESYNKEYSTNNTDEDFFDFIDIDSDEPLWDKLIQSIIDGKVIPVIGSEMLTVRGKDINKYIIDGLAQRKLRMPEEKLPHSFSELVYSKEYMNKYGSRDSIYYLVNKFFEKRIVLANDSLKKLLSIRQFPFVITTNYSPIVEQTMRNIWGDELRVMRFNNNPTGNADIKTDADLRKPTVYYMFGKVCSGLKQYVLTDTDMLDFVSSWLTNENKVRPKNLCNGLKDKYLLVLGNNFNNWLFRFIWYSMRKADLGNGMLAYNTLDEQLLSFLERTETFVKENIPIVVDQIVSRLTMKLAENENVKFETVGDNMDIFISYSRSDSDVAEKLYEALTAQGKKVWYDKKNITEGGNFLVEIKRAIRTSKYFVPIFSENITKEKNDSHVYRNEWEIATEVATSMGRTYIIPLAEEGFDFYRAAIPDKMQRHNALYFSRNEDIVQIADRIIHKINQD